MSAPTWLPVHMGPDLQKVTGPRESNFCFCNILFHDRRFSLSLWLWLCPYLSLSLHLARFLALSLSLSLSLSLCHISKVFFSYSLMYLLNFLVFHQYIMTPKILFILQDHHLWKSNQEIINLQKLLSLYQFYTFTDCNLFLDSINP